jgi:response regulator RpfG family c-di-GMP phosphodiesterase
VIEAFNMDAINEHVLKPWDNNDLLKVVDEQLQLSFEMFGQEQEKRRENTQKAPSFNRLLRAG